jgi:hypothetical protein
VMSFVDVYAIFGGVGGEFGIATLTKLIWLFVECWRVYGLERV